MVGESYEVVIAVVEIGKAGSCGYEKALQRHGSAAHELVTVQWTGRLAGEDLGAIWAYATGSSGGRFGVKIVNFLPEATRWRQGWLAGGT